MKRSGNGSIIFPDKQSSLWEKASTSVVLIECCWLGGRRNDALMAPNGVSWSIKVRCLRPRTNLCLTKSNFTMTVGLLVFQSDLFLFLLFILIYSFFHVLNDSGFFFSYRQAGETRCSRWRGCHVFCQNVGSRVHNQGRLQEELLQGLEEGETS